MEYSVCALLLPRREAEFLLRVSGIFYSPFVWLFGSLLLA
jgi:hypothetical protein